MIGVPFAHVGGLPVEETIASSGPALLVALGVAWAQLGVVPSEVRQSGCRGLVAEGAVWTSEVVALEEEGQGGCSFG
jgi:hypothetical protein